MSLETVSSSQATSYFDLPMKTDKARTAELEDSASEISHSLLSEPGALATLYDLLGVEATASRHVIKKAFKHKVAEAKKTRETARLAELRRAAHATVRGLEGAYRVLRDVNSRAAYDRSLELIPPARSFARLRQTIEEDRIRKLTAKRASSEKIDWPAARQFLERFPENHPDSLAGEPQAQTDANRGFTRSPAPSIDTIAGDKTVVIVDGPFADENLPAPGSLVESPAVQIGDGFTSKLCTEGERQPDTFANPRSRRVADAAAVESWRGNILAWSMSISNACPSEESAEIQKAEEGMTPPPMLPANGQLTRFPPSSRRLSDVQSRKMTRRSPVTTDVARAVHQPNPGIGQLVKGPGGDHMHEDFPSPRPGESAFGRVTQMALNAAAGSRLSYRRKRSAMEYDTVTGAVSGVQLREMVMRDAFGKVRTDSDKIGFSR